MEVSNSILDLLVENKADQITPKFVEDSMKKSISPEAIQNINAQLKKIAGPIKVYKKMQWGFGPKKVNGKDLLYSIKIVEHEKKTFNYFFVFFDDGKYEKIVGIYTKEKTGTRPAISL